MDVEGTTKRLEQQAGAPKWKSRSSALVLFLLGLSSLGSLWSAYQSNLWNRIQTFQLSTSAALSREAHDKTTRTLQQRTLDAALFVEYARDIDNGDTRMAEFVLERMRPDLRDTIRAWAALHPLQTQQAPASPFVMPQYEIAADAEVADLGSRSANAYDQAQHANVTSGSYNLLTVLYGASLFLAGLAAAMDDRRARLPTLLTSFAFFLIATGALTRLPVAAIG